MKHINTNYTLMNNACVYAHKPYFSRYSKREQLTFVLGGLYLLYRLGKTFFLLKYHHHRKRKTSVVRIEFNI